MGKPITGWVSPSFKTLAYRIWKGYRQPTVETIPVNAEGGAITLKDNVNAENNTIYDNSTKQSKSVWNSRQFIIDPVVFS